jgi:hypothetical protein
VDAGIDKGIWREAISPAISLLMSVGGGEVLVYHRPGELLR